jgi:succinate dehydrogenase/fumarate reductase-like Fe-S protein
MGIMRRRRGLAAFEASYANDRLLPVTPEERRLLAQFGRCIACGLCDNVLPPGNSVPAGTFAGPMDLMLASSRSMPDFDAAARSFAAMDRDALEALERRCPARVPMAKIADFVRSKA